MTASDRFAVVGLGTMGRSIARLLRTAGHEVRGFDPRAADDFDGIRLSSTLEECVAGCSTVFEAVNEDLGLKSEILAAISSATDGLISSNTSTFAPSVLAAHVDRPERFLVGHFFNPADLIPLVEVVPHAATSASELDRFVALMRELDRHPVILRAERAGFVANRLQAALLREALALVDAGVVSPEDLDAIVVTGLGPRWAAVGPIGVADLGGLDVFRAVCAQVFPTLETSAEPPASLLAHVARGELGAKTGTGFYRHSAESVARSQEAVSRVLRASRPTSTPGEA